MKIQSVAGSRHSTLRRGDPIQLSAEEKAKIMASETVIKSSETGLKRIPIKEEVIGTVQVSEGRKGVRDTEPTQYTAVVRVTFKTLDLNRDRLFSAKSVVVKLRFKDSKDDLGMPDLELVSHQFV